MLGVSFNIIGTLNFFLLVVTLLYILEFFYIVSLGRIVYWYIRKTSGSLTLLSYKEINYYINMQAFLLFTVKLDFAKELWNIHLYMIYVCVFLLILKVLLYLSKIVIIHKESLSTNFTALMFSYIVIVNIIFIFNFILFLFVLELLGVVYYFFFLSKLSSSNLTLIKYRNLVTLYLWTSFLILITLFISLLFTVFTYGTLQFYELSCFKEDFNLFVLHALFFSLLWKIGAPGYHFFKLQLYQFLPLYTLLLFSCLSLFLNFFLLQFLAISFSLIISKVNIFFLLYVTMFNILLLQRAQVHLPFYEFLGYSSINTLGVIFMILII